MAFPVITQDLELEGWHSGECLQSMQKALNSMPSTHTHTCTHTHKHAHAYKQMHTHTSTHMHTHIHKHPHAHAHTHVCMNAHTHGWGEEKVLQVIILKYFANVSNLWPMGHLRPG
jgi:cation transport ATPase